MVKNRQTTIDASKERWTSVDLHIHSVYSGGTQHPEEILRYAQAHLLDAVAICDHDRINGALEARELARGNPDYPMVLIAQEISAGDHVHFLLIGDRQPRTERGRSQLIQQIGTHHEEGGVVIVAHPWTATKNSWAVGCLKELAMAGCLDGMELFNSSILDLPQNANVLRRIWEEWILPYQLAVIGGSDFHRMHQGRFPGTGRTYLKTVTPGETGLMEALRARRGVAGLFHCQNIRLEWPRGGNHLLLGLEPWYSELKKLRQDVCDYAHGPFRFNPQYLKLLTSLVAAGHFQQARDLVDR